MAVLRLMETFSLDDVHVAVRDAIGLGALSLDAVSDRNPYPGCTASAPACRAIPTIVSTSR